MQLTVIWNAYRTCWVSLSSPAAALPQASVAERDDRAPACKQEGRTGMLTKDQYVARYQECLANAERTDPEIAQLWRRIADSYLFLSEHDIQQDAQRNHRLPLGIT